MSVSIRAFTGSTRRRLVVVVVLAVLASLLAILSAPPPAQAMALRDEFDAAQSASTFLADARSARPPMVLVSRIWHMPERMWAWSGFWQVLTTMVR